MAFILSKQLLEKEGIKNILDGFKYISNPFARFHACSKYSSMGGLPYLTLSDFDEFAESDWEQHFVYNSLTKKVSSHSQDWGYIVPLERYEQMKNDCTVISEDDNKMQIQYGRYLTARIGNSDELNKIQMGKAMGDIVEIERKITISIDKNGLKHQLRVYRNQTTGKEYAFLSQKDNGDFDDSFDIHADFIWEINPLTWSVDKQTGIAVCNSPLFLSERFDGEYKDSALAKFLTSDEFALELGVQSTAQKSQQSRANNPFGKKQLNLSLEQKIKRILMGEKRIPYLVGHPGIGKTQIAKSINKNCLSYNIATFTPDTFTGKTMIVPGAKTITNIGFKKTVEESAKGYTSTSEPEWHRALVELSNECKSRNERCVLLLDEFAKLTPNMQVFINGIVDEPRTIAGWIIPDNVDIILAGNTEEYSDAAFNISGEVASRLTKLEVTPDAIDWLKWASKNKVDPIVRAYLHLFPKKIIVDVKDNDGEYDYALSLTPRSWDQKISEELKASREIGSYPYLEPYMDEANRKDFESFIDTYFELGIEEILKGNFPTDLYDFTAADIQMIINCLIATATNEEELANALRFIQKNGLKEYQMLFEKVWTTINNSDDDILTLKLALNEVSEMEVRYGKH